MELIARNCGSLKLIFYIVRKICGMEKWFEEKESEERLGDNFIASNLRKT